MQKLLRMHKRNVNTGGCWKESLV